MQIALIASPRHPIAEPFAGGLEKQTYDLATGLQGRGHDVTVFAAEGSDPELDVEVICGDECRQAFSPAAMQDPSALAEPFMRTHHAFLHLMMDLMGRDLDLVQNSSLHYLPVSFAPSLACPVVTTLHSPPTPWLENALRTCPPGDGGSFLVSVSETNAASWRQHAQVGRVIPNGIDLDVWPYSDRGDPDTVVWAGRIVPEKAPSLAIEAAHAAGRRIVLAGPLDDDGYGLQVLDRLGPDDEYAGHLDQDGLAELVGSAGVFVCTPDWEEPFGLVVAEALACGTPVASFDRGAIHEVVDERTGVLADPGDIDGLAAAIERAQGLNRSDCRARAESEFSVGRMVDRYEQLYSELLS